MKINEKYRKNAMIVLFGISGFLVTGCGKDLTSDEQREGWSRIGIELPRPTTPRLDMTELFEGPEGDGFSLFAVNCQIPLFQVGAWAPDTGTDSMPAVASVIDGTASIPTYGTSSLSMPPTTFLTRNGPQRRIFVAGIFSSASTCLLSPGLSFYSVFGESSPIDVFGPMNVPITAVAKFTPMQLGNTSPPPYSGTLLSALQINNIPGGVTTCTVSIYIGPHTLVLNYSGGGTTLWLGPVPPRLNIDRINFSCNSGSYVFDKFPPPLPPSAVVQVF